MVMEDKRVNMIPEMPDSLPIVFNREICTGCNRCDEICQVDVFIPNPDKKKKVPLIIYPGECWYCGCCVMVCPEEGAIQLYHPLMNQVNWIEKSKLTKFG